MKRQNIRKAVLIISLLLFPVTIYYFSPYLIIQGASEGITTGSGGGEMHKLHAVH